MDNNIIIDLKDNCGLTCQKITPVTGGWLNQKWKISTVKGEFHGALKYRGGFDLKFLKVVQKK